MANEIYKLNVDGANYPIYGEGVKVEKHASTADFHPIAIFKNGLSADGGYNKLCTLQSNEQDRIAYKYGDIISSSYSYSTSTVSSSLSFDYSFSNINQFVAFYKNEMSLASNMQNLTAQALQINATTGTVLQLLNTSITDFRTTYSLNPGEAISISNLKLTVALIYSNVINTTTNLCNYGPYKFSLGNESNDVSSYVYILDSSNNILSVSSINVGGAYIRTGKNNDSGNVLVYNDTTTGNYIPNSNTPSGISSIIDASYKFIPPAVNITLPTVTYTNVTKSTVGIKIVVVPIINYNYAIKSGQFVLPALGSLKNSIFNIYSTASTSLLDACNTYPGLSYLHSKVGVSSGTITIKKISKTSSNIGSSTSTNSKAIFASNGLWIGDQYSQIQINSNTNNGSYIKLRSEAGGLSFRAPGKSTSNITKYVPTIELDTTNNSYGENAKTLCIKLPSEGSLMLSGGSSGTSPVKFVPESSNYSYLGSSSAQWNCIYGKYIYHSGTLISSSDERYKYFSDDITIDFDKLKSIPKKKFTWKEGRFFDNYKLHLGTSAQKVKELYPELVNIYNAEECDDINSEKAILGVDYEKLSLVALAAIDKLHERLEILEQDNKLLKAENIKLYDRITRLENKCIDFEKTLIDLNYTINKK